MRRPKPSSAGRTLGAYSVSRRARPSPAGEAAPGEGDMPCRHAHRGPGLPGCVTGGGGDRGPLSVGRGSVAALPWGADPEEVSWMVTAEDVRRLAGSLPRSEERLIHDHLKFRVGRLVFLSISPNETSMGFAFPKEERAALVASEPEKFHMPVASDERYNWVRVWLDAIDEAEMRELVLEAWRMVVPKRVAASYEGP